MGQVKLPSYSQTDLPSISDVFESIRDSDQFDDWIPDPVYYEDQWRLRDQFFERIQKQWDSGEILTTTFEIAEVPRANGQNISALTFPLDTRVCAHLVVGVMANRIAELVYRDKVYGFEYRQNRKPLFSVTGKGMEQAAEYALAGVLEYGQVFLVDVVRFLPNTSFEALARTLMTVGGRPDEIQFLRNLIPANSLGLPAIDDAFGFIYNFYLRPVDKMLYEAKANFVRYGDEYFIFEEKDIELLQKGLKRIDLESRIKKELKREELIHKPDEALAEEMVNLLAPFLEIVWEGCTYSWFSLQDNEAMSFEDFFDRFGNTYSVPNLIDGYHLLPLLREIHQRRQHGVLLIPPFDIATEDFQEYLKKLTNHRKWLEQALTSAIEKRATWQIAWVIPLLSDLGWLTSNEIDLLQEVLLNRKIGKIAKVQARLALARSSTLSTREFWFDAQPKSDGYDFRSALLAASYLAQRGIHQQWNDISHQGQSLQPELTRLLASQISEVTR